MGVLKWGRDGSGNWKQISVIKSFCCLSSSGKGTFCILGDGASQEGNVCAQDALHQDRDIL